MNFIDNNVCILARKVVSIILRINVALEDVSRRSKGDLSLIRAFPNIHSEAESNLLQLRKLKYSEEKKKKYYFFIWTEGLDPSI